jgi:hypothetical protein
MFKSMFARLILAGFFATTALVASVSASHSWGFYHWARTANPFTLTVINSTTADWDGYVGTAVGDWSQSTVLDMVEEVGSTESKDRRQCQKIVGKLHICNLAYGYNGWLGIAGISIDPDGHIVTGYTKLNDSYFGLDYYDNDLWKLSVTCQELGHNLGLDHQDENFDSNDLNSCMDYQDPPFDRPNQHDYEQLGIIYEHTDSYNSYVDSGGGDGGGNGCNAPAGKGCNKAGVGQDNSDNGNGWGISLGRRGNREKFIRIDPDGTRHITFVTWVAGH